MITSFLLLLVLFGSLSIRRFLRAAEKIKEKSDCDNFCLPQAIFGKQTSEGRSLKSRLPKIDNAKRANYCV